MSRSGVISVVVTVPVVVAAVVGMTVYLLSPVRVFVGLSEDRYKVDSDECSDLPLQDARFDLFTLDGTPLTSGTLKSNGSMFYPDGTLSPGHCGFSVSGSTEIPRFKNSDRYLMSIEGSTPFEVANGPSQAVSSLLR